MGEHSDVSIRSPIVFKLTARVMGAFSSIMNWTSLSVSDQSIGKTQTVIGLPTWLTT